MAGEYFEPFPRQALLGKPSASMTYFGEPLDVREWKTVCWWFQVYTSLPGVVGNPATLYLDTSEDVAFGDYHEMIPGGESPAVGTIASGAVANAGRFLRPRIVIALGETAVVSLRLIGRRCCPFM